MFLPSQSIIPLKIHFCMPFGKLANYLMLKGKNQAFVEYEAGDGAQMLVGVAEACPMAIRGRTIFCQFSNTHKQLRVENGTTSTTRNRRSAGGAVDAKTGPNY